jgi:hypothetical protein
MGAWTYTKAEVFARGGPSVVWKVGVFWPLHSVYDGLQRFVPEWYVFGSLRIDVHCGDAGVCGHDSV